MSCKLATPQHRMCSNLYAALIVLCPTSPPPPPTPPPTPTIPSQMRLISRVHTFVTINVLPYGQLAAKGIAISFPVEVGELVSSLPRPRGDSGTIVVQVARNTARQPPADADQGGAEQGEEGGEATQPQPPPVPREFTVRHNAVVRALRWLMAHNILYSDVRLQEWQPADQHAAGVEVAAAAAAEEAAAAAAIERGGAGDEGQQPPAFTVVMEEDPAIQLNALDDAVNQGGAAAHAAADRLYFRLERNDNQPVSMHTQRALEVGTRRHYASSHAVPCHGIDVLHHCGSLCMSLMHLGYTHTLQALAFPGLYPNGRNHWGRQRDERVTLTMYFRQRIMNVDKRFQVGCRAQ